MSEYPKFGSIPRLHREITITEKIDGTNGLISIEHHAFGAGVDCPKGVNIVFGSITDESGDPVTEFWVRAGSRNRWLAEGDDNAGFAAWVAKNRRTLVEDLGPGLHYGEWWGAGIQRGYGLPKGEKRFSLFNVSRWTIEEEAAKFSTPRVRPIEFRTPGLGVVPVLLWRGDAHVLNEQVRMCLGALRLNGSFATEQAYMNPEGIVLYHHAANALFKVTLKDDEVPKKVAASRSKGVAA